MKNLLILALLVLNLGTSAQKKDSRLWRKAQNLHQRIITIDTHNDTPILLLKDGFDIGEQHNASECQVDFPKMDEGSLDVSFFGVFTGQKPRTKANYRHAFLHANTMIDSIHAMVVSHPDFAQLAYSPENISNIQLAGKHVICIGMENGFPIAKELSRIEGFYNRGVRYITLCHSFHNDICDSSSDLTPPEHGGVSEFGQMVIHEMNRLGMMVDVSHLSDDSFFDVMNMSQAPVIASHSCARAVANHDRNMSDEMIKKLAENGGVIQMCLLDDYIKEPDTSTERYAAESRLMKIYRTKYSKMSDQEKEVFEADWRNMKKLPKKLPTVADMVDHIDHIVQLVGVDYVGIGSDFDGGGGLADCNDVSQFPNITYELLKRDYKPKDIRKIWGGNFLRVWREVEKVSGKLDAH
ncbi:dipeptidase [Sunxiuqinia indica]|uniref:dipeptidase n=1 Tax=Sunxiuqinia indica TaxID=2692584 RepID=UPI0013573B89|nr:dipeptidase [Sunxiuqinia indica]